MKATEVSAGLVFHKGKLLITQRRPQDHLGGLWEFPGGKREPGETFEACLIRELREELDINVQVGELLEDITHHYTDKSVRLRFYRCELTGGTARPIACHALTWVTGDQLADYTFPAADQQLLTLLQTRADLWR